MPNGGSGGSGGLQVALRVVEGAALRAKAKLDAEAKTLAQCDGIERRAFPKHEALSAAGGIAAAATKPNAALIVAQEATGAGGVLAYAVVEWRSLAGGVGKLCVKESCRRRGLGERTLRTALRVLLRRRVSVCTLHVDPQRAAAVALYRKLGFVQDGEAVKDYYAPGRDAWRMALEADIYKARHPHWDADEGIEVLRAIVTGRQ